MYGTKHRWSCATLDDGDLFQRFDGENSYFPGLQQPQAGINERLRRSPDLR